MTVAEVVGIVALVVMTLIGGMAGLIKTMVLSQLKENREQFRESMDEAKKTLQKLLEGQDELKGDLHEIDLRVTKLEAEHKLRGRCFMGGDE